MKNLYSYLLKNINLSIMLFYTFFISAFFIINIMEESITTTESFRAIYEEKELTIETIIQQVNYSHGQVTYLVYHSELNQPLYEQFRSLFLQHPYVSNFILIKNHGSILYQSNPLLETTLPDVSAQNTHIILKNGNVYNIYYQDSLYTYVYSIQPKIITNLITIDSSYMLQIATEDGNLINNQPFVSQYKVLFKPIRYTQTIYIMNHQYYFEIKTPLSTIISNLAVPILYPLIISLFILLISLLIIRKRMNHIFKRPLENFINEMENLNDSTLIDIQPTEYIELNQIYQEYKKNNLFLKQNYEIKIDEMKQELAQADEGSKSKSLFLANMSHEMRTPLNSIIGYAQLIKKIGLNEPEKVNEYFECINTSSEILLQKVNDILDLSKIESNKFELIAKSVKFRDCIKDIYDLLIIQANKKNIKFTFYVDPQIPTFLEIDETRLKQILINLCSNSIKFTDKGYVKLEIELFLFKFDSVVIEYKITDSGCGIPKEMIDSIFYPFVQVNSKNKYQLGTGLGLTIARDLVRLMGGEVNVTSKENVGSIFYFTTVFKISDRLNQNLQISSDIDNNLFMVKIKPVRILLAEDNVINQLFMKEIFAVFKKTDIDIASDGREAFEYCKRNMYDLILMDIQMPNMDGLEATKWIRTIKGYDEVVIIALTANAFPEQIKQYLKLGLDDFLAKPIDLAQFKHILMNHI